MEVLGIECGQNGIASQVLEFRKKVAQRLLEEANISCSRTDVINSGGPGYRLQEWITIEVGTRAGSIVGAGATSDPSVVDAGDDSVVESLGIDGLSERQRWAI